MDRLTSLKRARTTTIAGSALGAILAFQPGIALAQQSEAAARSEEVRDKDDIIVTATRRETSLQDTALSITAISGDQLAQRALQSTADVVTLVPGVALLNAQPGNNAITIRGVGTSSSTETVVGGITNSTTSVYVNQLPVTTTTQKTPDYRFIDLERIEVLRGPQGTLYGQSAMGGVVRYITNRPDPNRFSTGLNTYVSFTEDGGTNFGLDGFANIPIVSDKLAVRAVAYAYSNDGFIDVVGRDPKKNANEEGTFGGRLALRYKVSDAVTLDLTYLHHDVDLKSTQTISSTYAPTRFAYSNTNPFASQYSVSPALLAAGAPAPETPAITPISTNRLVFQHRQPLTERADVYNAELQATVGPFDANLIGGRKEVSSTSFIEGGDRSGGSTGSFTNPTTRSSVKSDTVELRIVSNWKDAPVDVIAGVYYEDTDGTIAQRAVTTGAPFTSYLLLQLPNPVPPPATFPFPFLFTFANLGDVTIDAARQLKYRELAFYGELRVNLTDRLHVTGGYRRANVKNNYQWLYSRGTLDGFFGRDPSKVQGAEENVNLYKVNLEYKPSEDILLYGQASSGYRPGGFNVGNPTAQLSNGSIGIPDNEFSSDTLWNYEVGAHTSWANGRFILNVAGYRIDWSDIQLTSNIGAPSFYTSVQNTGEARIWGAEVEAVARVTERLRLSATYNYTDAKLTSVRSTAFGTGDPRFVGQRLPGTAKHTWSALADWTTPISAATDLLVNATYRHVGARPGELGVANTSTPSYDILDLRAGVALQNGLQVQLFVDNITNEIAINRVEPTALAGYRIFSIGRPRTIGIRTSFRY